MTRSGSVYREYHLVSLDVRALELGVERLEKEVDNIVSRSGPRPVVASRWETNGRRVTTFKAVNDKETLETIADMTRKIGDKKRELSRARSHMKQLEHALKSTSEKIDDLRLTVFIKAYVEDKANEVIADELGYSLQTIWNTKTELNKMIEGEMG